MNILSLFSGIGGLELGLEWAGLGVTRWQVEQDAFARQVLARHWPEAQRFEDVREVTGEDFPGCDVICGGFPCQDISQAGKREGIDGERSGLWREYARLVRELRPRLVIVENVAALAVRGLDRVLGDLAALGYDVEWEIVSAWDAGAPHLRRRLFIIGAPGDTASHRKPARAQHGGEASRLRSDAAAPRPVAHTQDPDHSPCPGAHRGPPLQPGGGDGRTTPGHSGWHSEPQVGRVANGIPHRVSQLRALGNAVVPQVGQIVGQRARLILQRGYVSDDRWELSYD
jgi:DNA (cytosine-5)-methyltransferase 1